ncbi:MAG TPA: ATP-binding protein, partial [Candidatus Dormibacteraeota bacterium]
MRGFGVVGGMAVGWMAGGPSAGRVGGWAGVGCWAVPGVQGVGAGVGGTGGVGVGGVITGVGGVITGVGGVITGVGGVITGRG